MKGLVLLSVFDLITFGNSQRSAPFNYEIPIEVSRGLN